MKSFSSSSAWTTILKNKWFLLAIVVFATSFYWFQVRPIQLSRACAVQSSTDARKLLKSKASMAEGTPTGDDYQKLIEKDLYLRSDYESFLMKCLIHHNITKPVLPAPKVAAPPKEEPTN